MGVMIFLHIMPHHIKKSEWEKVYNETVETLNNYPFMDSVADEDLYNIPWVYLTRTKERNIPFVDNQWGWHTFGDERSLRTGESFKLIKDLDHYRNQARKAENCQDILFAEVNNHIKGNKTLESMTVNDVELFGSKTQGEPFHIPILAIACLIESRFPNHAIVSGDISLAQIEQAIEWANTFLTYPIIMTERADNIKLLSRIKTMIQNEPDSLEALMQFTMHDPSVELGNLIRTQFSQETITEYYIKLFNRHEVGTIGFSDVFSDFISLGFSLETVCDICVVDPNGCNYDPDEFAKAIMSMEWPSQEENPIDLFQLKLNAQDVAEPETIPSMFSKTFLRSMGFKDVLKTFLTLEEVVNILSEKMTIKIDLEKSAEDVKKEREMINQLIEEIQPKFEHENIDGEKAYVINNPEELIYWKPGDTIHPNVEQSMIALKEFVGTMVKRDHFDQFQKLSDREKMRYLIKSNRYFNLHKTVWDEILAQIHDEQFTNRVLAILSLKADGKNQNELFKNLLNNQALFQSYM